MRQSGANRSEVNLGFHFALPHGIALKKDLVHIKLRWLVGSQGNIKFCKSENLK